MAKKLPKKTRLNKQGRVAFRVEMPTLEAANKKAKPSNANLIARQLLEEWTEKR